jgi:hypothetical protein
MRQLYRVSIYVASLLDNQFTGPIVNLVELTLGTSYDSDGTSMTHFLDLLESNINLCHISLLSAGPQSDPHRIVHLNSLEILTMEETPTKEALSHLSLPATTHITIANFYGTPYYNRIVEHVLPASLIHLPGTEELGRY